MEGHHDKYRNVKKEHDLLKSKIIDTGDPLIPELFKINSILWELEDAIRSMSKAKSYDINYIRVAEQIHAANDYRYSLKRKLNEKYDSDLREEKLHSTNSYTDTDTDTYVISVAMETFKKDPVASLVIFEKILNEQVLSPLTDQTARIVFSYITNCHFLGQTPEQKFTDLIPEIERLLRTGEIKSDIKEYHLHLALWYLHVGEYSLAYPHLPWLQVGTGPHGIKPETISKPSRPGQPIVLYSSGGLGDIIMYARFIPEYADKYKSHDITLLCDKKMLWLLNWLKVHYKLDNLTCTIFNDNLPFGFCHNNLCCLLGELKYTVNTLSESNYSWLREISPTSMPKASGLSFAFDKDKRKVVLNWKGNPSNMHELNNRRVPLDLLLETLNSKGGLQLICVQPDQSEEETKLLEQYGVMNLGPHVDKGGDVFYDTISIIQRSDIVVSSDTSLLHLAASLDAKTIGLLTIGCDWRWQSGDWYPNMTKLRQQSYGDWNSVMNELSDHLDQLTVP